MNSLISKLPATLLYPSVLMLPEEQEHKKNTRALLTAQDIERSKVGTILRDDIGPLLSSARLMLQQELHQADDGPLSSQLESIFEQLDAGISATLRLLTLFNDSSITEIALKDIVYDMMAAMEKATGIKTWLDFDDNIDRLLSQEQKRTVYMIAQQQISNITKHSHAKHVVIGILCQGANINIMIGDDGEGVDLNQLQGGTGLMNIYSRVYAYNGFMQIESAPGKGFHLDIKIPLAAG